MKLYKISNEEKPEIRMPTVHEIAEILYNYPLFKKWKKKIKSAYLVGSFSRGEQHKNSDVDILIEIAEVKGFNASEYTSYMRRPIQDFFVKNDIRGKLDAIHPQWDGRRMDIYYTYDAKADQLPKIKLQP